MSDAKTKKVGDFNPHLIEIFDTYLPLDDYVSNDYVAFGDNAGSLDQSVAELIRQLAGDSDVTHTDPLWHNAKVRRLLDYGTETIGNGQPSEAFLEWITYRLRLFLEREFDSVDEAFGLRQLSRGKNNVAFDNQRRSIKAYVLLLHIETKIRGNALTREMLKRAERAAYIAYYGEPPEDNINGTATDNIEKVIKPKLKDAGVFIRVGSVMKERK